MPWREIFRRFLQSKDIERDLSESRFIRRLAQLTVYQIARTSEWSHEQIEKLFQNFDPKRFSMNFMNNLRKEIRKKPPNK